MIELIQITAAILGILSFFKPKDLGVKINKKGRFNYTGLETWKE